MCSPTALAVTGGIASLGGGVLRGVAARNEAQAAADQSIAAAKISDAQAIAALSAAGAEEVARQATLAQADVLENNAQISELKKQAALVAAESLDEAAVGQEEASKLEAQSLIQKAEFAERQGYLTMVSANYETDRMRSASKVAIADTANKYLSQGVALEGSPADILIDQADQDSLDQQAVLFSANIQRNNFKFEGALARANAERTLIGGAYEAASTRAEAIGMRIQAGGHDVAYRGQMLEAKQVRKGAKIHKFRAVGHKALARSYKSTAASQRRAAVNYQRSGGLAMATNIASGIGDAASAGASYALGAGETA